MNSLIRKGYVLQNAEMPEICLAIVYFKNKTAKMFSRDTDDGDVWHEVAQVDDSKWEPFSPGDAAAKLIIDSAGAESADFFKLTAEASKRKGTGFTTK